MKIYISGKVTGEEYAGCIRKFGLARHWLAQKCPEAETVNPLLIGTSPEKSWEENMRLCVKALTDCGAIYLLDDWTESRGAKIEQFLAKTLKMKIIREGGCV